MAGRSRSLAVRATVALGLLLGFYVLVAVVAAALVAAPVLEWMFLNRLHIQLLLLPLLGVSLLWSILPRRARFEPPGPEFDRRTQPELTALVERVAAAVGQPVPAHLYLLDDVNAFVTQVGGFLGFGGRRVLAVGVPLMQVLSTDELESVLAHEFGHFHGGDTRLGPVVYQARAAMGRTLDAAHQSMVRVVFTRYAELYLRVTQAMSREQERSADALAASVTSPAIAASALARLPVASTSFGVYLERDYLPALRAGFRVPYLDGFESFLHSSFMGAHGDAITRQALTAATGSRYDSHPTPGERIRALGCDPETYVDQPRPTEAAISLLRNRDDVEHALLTAHGVAPGSLTVASWADVASDVIVPRWRSQVTEMLGATAPRLTPAELPVDGDGVAALGERVLAVHHRTGTRPEREAIGADLAYAMLGAAAVDAGWTVVSGPGQDLTFRRNAVEADLFTAYGDTVAGRTGVDEWRRLLAEWHLDHLVPAAPAAPGIASAPAMTGGWTDPTPAAEPDPAPVPAAYRGTPPRKGLGRAHLLVVEGDMVAYAGRQVRAAEVIAVTYKVTDGTNASIKLATAVGALQIDLAAPMSEEKVLEPTRHVVEWAHRLVAPRVVDQYLDQLRDGGTVEIGDLQVTAEGLVHRGTVVPWREVAGARFTGQHIEIGRVADTLSGVSVLTRIKSTVDNAVFLDELLHAASLTAQGSNR